MLTGAGICWPRCLHTTKYALVGLTRRWRSTRLRRRCVRGASDRHRRTRRSAEPGGGPAGGAVHGLAGTRTMTREHPVARRLHQKAFPARDRGIIRRSSFREPDQPGHQDTVAHTGHPALPRRSRSGRRERGRGRCVTTDAHRWGDVPRHHGSEIDRQESKSIPAAKFGRLFLKFSPGYADRRKTPSIRTDAMPHVQISISR